MPHIKPNPSRPPPRDDDQNDNRAYNNLAKAISTLAHAIDELGKQRKEELDWLKSTAGFVTKCDLKESEGRIMSAISDFAAKQNAHNDKIDAAVTGLEGDIKVLNDKITELQNNPGPITPEDQALLDQIEARGASIAQKLDALDALTPPTPPPA